MTSEPGKFCGRLARFLLLLTAVFVCYSGPAAKKPDEDLYFVQRKTEVKGKGSHICFCCIISFTNACVS